MNPQKNSSRYNLVLSAGFIIMLLLSLSGLNPELSELSGDSARFLLLAKSIASGKGYQEIEKPNPIPHTEYMPGLPLLLSPLSHFFPKSLIPMKLLIIGFAFLSLVFFYLFLFQEWSWARLAMTFTFSLTPFFLGLQTMVLADLPHLAMLLLAFFYFEKVRAYPETKILPWLFAGFLVALAFYFRQIAIIIFFAGILTILIDKKIRQKRVISSYALGFLLFAGIWYIRNLLIAGSLEPSYAHKLFSAKPSNPFAGTLTIWELLERIISRIELAGAHIGKDILLGPEKGLSWLWGIILAILLIGWLYELLKRKQISAVYFFPYLLLICSWEGLVPRYLLPLLPLAILFFYRGLYLLSRIFFKNELAPGISTIPILIWLIFNLLRSINFIQFQHTPIFYPPENLPSEKTAVELLGKKNFAYYWDAYLWQKKGEQYLLVNSVRYYHFFAMAEWVKQNLGPDPVIVCRKPRMFAWLTQGKAIQLPAELTPEKFLEQVRKRGGQYILIEEISRELHPLLLSFQNQSPEEFILKAKFSDTYLLEISAK